MDAICARDASAPDEGARQRVNDVVTPERRGEASP